MIALPSKGEVIPFAVIFDPAEVDTALDTPTKDIKISENTLFPGLADPEPCKVICFPFAQHYIADSIVFHSEIAAIQLGSPARGSFPRSA